PAGVGRPWVCWVWVCGHPWWASAGVSPGRGGGVKAVKPPPICLVWGWLDWEVVFGGVLLSHDLAVAVPSALRGLASGFGMGPGVSRLAMTAVTLWRCALPAPLRFCAPHCCWGGGGWWCAGISGTAQWTRSRLLLFCYPPPPVVVVGVVKSSAY